MSPEFSLCAFRLSLNKFYNELFLTSRRHATWTRVSKIRRTGAVFLTGVTVFLLCFRADLSAEGLRKWTDNKGRKVEAEYVGLAQGKVQLKLAGGKIIPFPFAQLSPEDQAYVKKVYKSSPASASQRIDELVDQQLAKQGVQGNPMTTDEQFVRRVYLELAGTIPTFDQTVTFLESKDRDKRRKLIGVLLDSDAFVSQSFNWQADMLRLRSHTNDFYIFETYLQWVKESIAENKPYDRFVYEMLTAKGRMWDNPASGYFLRDRGMPLGNLSTTVAVFLGTEITCAQCHDHPFEDWTQMDFYQLAAYLGQRRDKSAGREWWQKSKEQMKRVEAEQRKVDPSLGANGFFQPFRNVNNSNNHRIWDDPKMALKLPEDYRYEDAKAGELVTARTLFGDSIDPSAYESPRIAFATWLTSKENSRFALTAANRLWKRAFGLALHEPVDNISDIKNAQNPELLAYLESLLKDLNFDTKEFLRAIYSSKAWQRRATLQGPTLVQIDANRYPFPGPLLKRMTAEQLWDSFLTLSVPNPMAYPRDVAKHLTELIRFDLEKVSGAESIERTKKLREILAKTIRNGAPSLDAWSKERSSADKETGEMTKYAGAYLSRASELTQPSSSGHFLRAWGQSDRNLVDNASDNGSIPQILTMINGPFSQMLIKPDSLIFKTVGGQKGRGDKMENIFLSILNRYPVGKEKAICSRALREGEEGYGDLIWALVNTREFIFIR